MARISEEDILAVRDRADIVELISQDVQLKVSGSNNMGCCPFHSEKTPSFNVNAARQTFHCFGCGVGGDVFAFVQKMQGVEFPVAVRIVANRFGYPLPENSNTNRDAEQMATPQPKKADQNAWKPTEAQSPQDLWREKAEKLVDHTHQALLDTPDKLEYLAARGLDLAAVKKYRLGWLSKNAFRPRTSWGLPEEKHTKGPRQGKLKMLMIPTGIIIPYFEEAGVHRIRIRREEGQPRYYWLPGSGNDVVVLNPDSSVFVVIESDLDGLMIDHLVGDIVGTIPLGTSSARPRQTAATILQAADCILVALDHDKAGAKNMTWWRNIYQQAVRWPSVKGKDPGEDYQAGIDIRQWIIEGLPPGLRLIARKKAEKTITKTTPQVSVKQPEIEQPVVHEGESKNGHKFFITEGKFVREVQKQYPESAVFSFREMEALRGLKQPYSEIVIPLKQIFIGAQILRTTLVEA